MATKRDLQKRNLTFGPALALVGVMALPASALSAGCFSQNTQALQHATIEKNEFGSWNEPNLLLVGSEEEWNARMDEMAALGQLYILPAPAAPSVDWKKEMVVLVTLGACPTTGYGIEVTSVSRSGRKALMEISISTPHGGEAQTITLPYQMVRIQRSGLNGVEACYTASQQVVAPQSQAILTSTEEPGVRIGTWGELKSLYR